MKKTHWFRTTLITLVACGLAGLLLAVILFNTDAGRTSAASTIEFAFEGAAEGLAPNGQRFDLSGFYADEVLNAALEDAGLSDRYTADQLRENLLVSGVYPEDIVSQMTGYESMLTGNAGKVVSADYHATLYNVKLYNDFDKSISEKDLKNLLSAVLVKFRAYFEKTYSVFLTRDAFLDNLSAYDYPQQLELLEASVNRFGDFAGQMAARQSDFRLNGESFSDIAVRYENLLSVDLERLNGQITMNALSRDTGRLVSKYENQIRILEMRLKELEQEAKDTEELLDRYEKDNLIYVSTSDTLQQVGTNSTETYDTLVARYRTIENTIAERKKSIALLKLNLADIIGEDAPSVPAEADGSTAAENSESENTAALTETAVPEADGEEQEARRIQVENAIAAAQKKLEAVTKDFSDFLQAYSAEEMNDRTVALTAVKYNTPKLISGAFVVKAIKTAGPFCALGFIVCLICIIVSRVREEKERNA